MADIATLQAWLDEARQARHKLMIGKAFASVRVDGVSETTYTRADLNKLDAYITSLERQIAAASGSAAGRMGPIHFSF